MNPWTLQVAWFPRAQYGTPLLYINRGLNIQQMPNTISQSEMRRIKRCCGVLLLILDRLTWEMIMRDPTNESRLTANCTLSIVVSNAYWSNIICNHEGWIGDDRIWVTIKQVILQRTIRSTACWVEWRSYSLGVLYSSQLFAAEWNHDI